jgi:hypothetical protein
MSGRHPRLCVRIEAATSFSVEQFPKIHEQTVSTGAEERYPGGEATVRQGLAASGTAENARCDVNIRR